MTAMSQRSALATTALRAPMGRARAMRRSIRRLVRKSPAGEWGSDMSRQYYAGVLIRPRKVRRLRPRLPFRVALQIGGQLFLGRLLLGRGCLGFLGIILKSREDDGVV